MIKFQNIEYLIILLIILFLTILIQKRNKIINHKDKRQSIYLIMIFFVIGVVWDHFAIWRGHWIFPKESNVGIKIGLMPIEEYLFIFIIPYFVITTYNFAKKIFYKNIFRKIRNIF